MSNIIPRSELARDDDKTLKLFKALSLNLRERYGTHTTSRHVPLASDDCYVMMGKIPATFSTVAFYFYDKCHIAFAIRSSKGALWLESYKTMTFNGKRLRKGNSIAITSIEHLAEILEWITEEKDILCKNDDHWEYADEFHLWSFQT